MKPYLALVRVLIINDGHKMSFTNDKRPFAFDQDVNINAAIHLQDAVST